MVTSSFTEVKDENRRESWNQSMNRSQSLPTQLPARAHLPSFA
ncbi:phosphoenolpyruvate carboxylase, partial [Trifolium medium]|nr:phosphoenolpyruvate carboxylase [Trifolium medium]